MPKVKTAPRRPVGRPCKLYSRTQGILIGKVLEQIVHEAGLAFSMRAGRLEEHWEEYRDMLRGRSLTLISRAVGERGPAANFPTARKAAQDKAAWLRHFTSDEAWLRANLWYNGRDSKANRRPLVCNGHRLVQGDVKTREVPVQFHLWVQFWRDASLRVVYTYGLGVRAAQAMEATEEEPRILAYGLPDSTDAERHKGLCIDFDKAEARSTFGPLGVFNGACKLHANCGIMVVGPNDKGFPAWMSADCKLLSVRLLKRVRKGEELLVDYQLHPDDRCPLCTE